LFNLAQKEYYLRHHNDFIGYQSMKRFALVICLLGAHLSLAEDTQTGMVRVAAIQCPSVMGKTAENIRNITNLVRQAANMGARVVVLPECSVQGYLEPITWTSWSSSGTDGMDVRQVAEPVPGPSTKLFGKLADELNIYLCIGLIEAGTNGFFNAQVLLSPEGKLLAHHRKKALWTPGDSSWCTPGDRPIQVVKTEFGNMGLMICYDFHALPQYLAKRQADLVLYSVGWYGPNEKSWFSKSFPAKAVIPYNFHVIAANWSSPTEADEWPGRGHSCIITREGKVLAMSEKVSGNAIVIADLEIRKRESQTPKDTTR
jgi:predicted amidohydrolase